MGAKIIVIYFVLINIATLVVRGIDKRKAQHNKWRIRERTLLAFAGAGGRLGSLVAMELLRHKTIKGKFLIWFWLIVLAWIVGGIRLFIWLG